MFISEIDFIINHIFRLNFKNIYIVQRDFVKLSYFNNYTFLKT